MTMFEYKGKLFSTETIATVNSLPSDQISIHFNSGEKTPITMDGSIDEFLAASRVGPGFEAGLAQGFNQSGGQPDMSPREQRLFEETLRHLKMASNGPKAKPELPPK